MQSRGWRGTSGRIRRRHVHIVSVKLALENLAKTAYSSWREWSGSYGADGAVPASPTRRLAHPAHARDGHQSGGHRRTRPGTYPLAAAARARRCPVPLRPAAVGVPGASRATKRPRFAWPTRMLLGRSRRAIRSCWPACGHSQYTTDGSTRAASPSGSRWVQQLTTGDSRTRDHEVQRCIESA